jgi:ubiquinone/menaquinone biosynthesis C-methylase UbiE
MEVSVNPNHSLLENFLVEFHNARPGVTSRTYGTREVRKSGRVYPSSYECLLEVIPRDRPSAVVLDLGCGDGYLLSRLAARAQAGLTLVGVDLSAGELEAARHRLGASAQLYEGRAQALPLETSSVDYVVSHLALMLMVPLEEVLTEIRRVLRPGGVVSALVGAPPPISAMGEVLRAVLKAYPRKLEHMPIRFGDPRLGSSDGIHEVLAPLFKEIVLEEIPFCHRKTPREAWDWFTDMYDLYLFSQDLHGEIERRFVEGLEVVSGADGMLEFLEMSRQITATGR